MKQFAMRPLSLLAALALVLSLSTPTLATAETTAIQDYLNTTHTLLQSGYTQEETATLMAALSAEQALRLSGEEYRPELARYAALDYFHADLLDRYTAYGALNPKLSAEDVVTRVNIGLDGERYAQPQAIQNPDALDVLVNQYHSLGTDYVPELVVMDSAYTTVNNDRLHPTAYQWFKKMADDARLEGLTLRSVSAYRSYETQQNLYDRYVARDGVTAADTYSARPGHSEHQTGLALDINVAGSRYNFESGSEYQWLMDHCWEYGFILRYPSGATSITGFIFEPWHYRYVGIELAQQIRDSGLTYDEFVARLPVQTRTPQTPELQLNGQPLSGLIALDGQLYLPVQTLVQALGGSCSRSDDSFTISTPRLTRTLSLSSSALNCPYAVHGDLVYLELSDLSRLLFLSRWDRDNTILLSTNSAAKDWPFADVLPYHSFYEAILYVWKANLFSGTAADTFDPDASMTRGMAVTVLQKLDRKNTPSLAPLFPDVDAGAWYAAGVAWAAAVDMVSGYPDGLFRPDKALTREEAAMILFKFATHMGIHVYRPSLPTGIADASQVSDWATETTAWAYREGLLLLRSDNTLAAQQPITRAEMAHALAQLCEHLT